MEINMAKENKLIRMEYVIKDSGKIIKEMDLVN
jgi:hypothetical protein